MISNDPRLDRRPEFDPKSRNFPIRTLLTEEQLLTPRSYTWSLPLNLQANPLDQGREGACVGFYGANELAARPVPDANITNDIALLLYREAQKVDEWAGENYDGTSGLGLMRVMAAWGLITEYRWAFDIMDLVRAIGYKGPAGLGIAWYTGMFRPDIEGRLHVTGQLEGYHQILANRVTSEVYSVISKRRRIYLWNSWGKVSGWPIGWLTWDDAERLLHEQGDAVIPLKRVART